MFASPVRCADRIDFNDLENKAASPTTTALILCNPHSPVGRIWTASEFTDVATICARHGVFVIADEIHADLASSNHPFTPFATVAATWGIGWAALHGPIKTFGLAGVCDTLVVTDSDDVADLFEKTRWWLHLTRNNVCAPERSRLRTPRGLRGSTACWP